MFYKAMGNAHALAVSKGELIRRGAVQKSGQGTVEYVGLILLVSMTYAIAAMRMARGYLRSAPLAPYYEREEVPGEGVRSDDELTREYRRKLQTLLW